MLTAADLMTGEILAADAAWPVGQLAEFLCEHHISGAPVVAEDGRLIGVVSLTDVARATGRALHYHRHADEAHDFYRYGPAFSYKHGAHGPVEETVRVRDIMTPAVFDVPLGATAREIAELMLLRHIHRIFVTESGMVIGVITAFDMLKAVG
jgi:CBS domain-containing protein